MHLTILRFLHCSPRLNTDSECPANMKLSPHRVGAAPAAQVVHDAFQARPADLGAVVPGPVLFQKENPFRARIPVMAVTPLAGTAISWPIFAHSAGSAFALGGTPRRAVLAAPGTRGRPAEK